LLKNLTEIGLESKNYGWHSFRSVGATAVVVNDVLKMWLKSHERWKSDCAKDKHIRDSLDVKMSVSKKLGL